jgi:hypothetical protein
MMQNCQCAHRPGLATRMYGSPRDRKGKFGREDKSAQMYSDFGCRSTLLAMMSCARVCPSKSVGRWRRRRLRTTNAHARSESSILDFRGFHSV